MEKKASLLKRFNILIIVLRLLLLIQVGGLILEKQSLPVSAVSFFVILIIYFIIGSVLSLLVAPNNKSHLAAIILDSLFVVFCAYSLSPDVILLFLLPVVEISFFYGASVGMIFSVVLGALDIFLAYHNFKFAGAGTYLSNGYFMLLIIGAFLSYFIGDLVDQSRNQEGQVHSLLSLIEVGQQLGKSSSEEKILQMVVSMVKNLLEHNTIIVFVAEEGEKALLLTAKYYSSPFTSSLKNFSCQAHGGGVISNVFKSNKARLINNLANEEAAGVKIELPALEQLKSFVLVPLVYENQGFGLILMGHTIPNFYDEGNLRLLSIVANQAAIALKNIQLYQTTSRLAITDSVSGLYNHGHFQKSLSAEVKKAQEKHLPLTMCILDVDFFKVINDTYGHPEGDMVLRQIADVMRSVSRVTDICCRYGGDEFTVIMTNTGNEEGALVAERIRKEIEDMEINIDRQIAKITISAGVASLSENINSKEELIENADKALYRAKSQGKNQIQVIAG